MNELAYLLEPGPAPQAVGPTQSQSTQAMYTSAETSLAGTVYVYISNKWQKST